MLGNTHVSLWWINLLVILVFHKALIVCSLH